VKKNFGYFVENIPKERFLLENDGKKVKIKFLGGPFVAFQSH
jgi:hypothetical protein